MTNENGSAILWIFMAVVLFAALGTVTMQGSRTSSNMIDGEQASSIATQVISTGTAIKMAVKRLELRGCQDTEIGFDNTVWRTFAGLVIHGPAHNGNTPGDKCRIFNVAGGGLTATTFENNGAPLAAANVTSGHSRAQVIAVTDVGTTAPDLVLVTHYIDRNVCSSINDKLGIPNVAGLPPDDAFSGASVYNGTYGAAGAIGDNYAGFVGKTQGCLHFAPGGGAGLEAYDYHYYQVLIAR